MTTTEIVDHDDKTRALTREEFCELERMTIVTYKKLLRSGHGPEEVRVPGTAFVRITPEARRRWHAKIEQLCEQPLPFDDHRGGPGRNGGRPRGSYGS
jgi:hypothetical protein